MAKRVSKNRTRSNQIMQARSEKDPIPLLREAMRMLRRSHHDQALKLVNDARTLANNKEEEDTVQQVLAEIHFRAAMESPQSEQIVRLEKALALKSDDSRIRFRYAIALWRANRLPEALNELECAYQHNNKQPMLIYLLQLARLSQGKSWLPSDMTADCANTLHTVLRFLHQDHLPLPKPHLCSHPEMWQSLADMTTGGDNSTHILKEAANKSQSQEVKQILLYYQGVAAMRNEDKESARQAWICAKKVGLDTSWFNDNLSLGLRELAIELAAEEQWEAITNLTKQSPDQLNDRILNDTIGLAYFHLGYEQAQSNNWVRAAYFWREAEAWAGNRHIAQNLALAEEALENWAKAAEAWRDMVRRRPRNTNHPDYLDDNQISAIWRHTAECYRHIDNSSEVISCLRKAIKYAENDTDLRLELADELYHNDQDHSAVSELEHILEIDPNHTEALVRLANLNQHRPLQAIPLWQRVLATKSDNQDARKGLVEAYLRRLSDLLPSQLEPFVALALQDLPDDSRLLVSIAVKYQQFEHFDKAIEFFKRGYLAAPEDSSTVGLALHELIYLKAKPDFIEQMMSEVPNISNLFPSFWFRQAELALENDFEQDWVKRFLEEALAMAERAYIQESKATLLMTAYHILEGSGYESLRQDFAQRIRTEAPNSGGVELIEALSYIAKDNKRVAKRLFGRAKRNARRSKDKSALELIEKIEYINFSPVREFPSDLIMRLMHLFPEGLPSLELLEDFLDEL